MHKIVIGNRVDAIEHFEQLLADLEKRYQQERDALIVARDVAARFSGSTSGQSPPIGTPSRKSVERPIKARVPSIPTGESSNPPKVKPVKGHPFDDLSNRDIVRKVVLMQNDKFTLHDLIEQGCQIPSEKVQNLDRMVWSSALWQFAQQGLLEEIQKRKGNKAAIYRRISSDMSPPPNNKPSEFPLTDMVNEAVKALPQSVFGRVEVLEMALKLHPEHGDRLRADTVGAILNREAKSTRSNFRMIERSPTGNLYERTTQES